MRHNLDSDIIRVLYEKPRTIDEIRSAILHLRIDENRAGPLRGPLIVLWPFNLAIHVYYRPKNRQIRKHLQKLEYTFAEPRVYSEGKYFSLSPRGEERYHWYMNGFAAHKTRQ